jgi:hypothetical protein
MHAKWLPTLVVEQVVIIGRCLVKTETNPTQPTTMVSEGTGVQ